MSNGSAKEQAGEPQTPQEEEAAGSLEMEAESTGYSDGRFLRPHCPPSDSPAPLLDSIVTYENPVDCDHSSDDFRTSFTSSYESESSLTAHRVPPSLSTPATHLPNFEERFMQLPDMCEDYSPRHGMLDTALLEAAKANDEVRAEEILNLQLNPDAPNPNFQDETGKAALHYAAASGLVKMCTLLVDFGEKTDVNLTDNTNRTPLHYATASSHLEIVQFLLRCGADPSLRDCDGNTPLHYAARDDNDSVMTCFLRRNLDLDIKNSSGLTPAELAGPQTSLRLLMAQKRKRPAATAGKLMEPKPFSRILIEDSTQEEINILMGRMEARERDHPENEKKCGPEDFDLLQQLGKGSFGEVYLVRKKTESTLFAMKVLRKDKVMGQNLIKYALTERNVLSYIRHPFIVSLNFAFQTADSLFLILDYCPGGDMGWHLSKEKRFNEYRARIYASEVLLALEELHHRDIIFRDLKPDNVVFDSEGHAMLTDFGLSKEGVYGIDSAKSFCGSIAYLAPEVLKRQGHGKAVDWYLLGVLIYEMLVGIPPYFSRDKEQLFHNIQHGALKLPKFLSGEAKTIIRAVSTRQLLEREPRRRLGSGPKGSDEIKQFPFFKGINWAGTAKRELRPPVLTKPVVLTPGLPHEKVYGESPLPADGDSYLAGWSFVIS